MQLIGFILAWFLQIFFYLLLARMVLSFVPFLCPNYEPKGVILICFELVYSATDPPIRLARRLLPTGPSFGGVRLDLGFLLVWIAVVVCMQINAAVFL